MRRPKKLLTKFQDKIWWPPATEGAQTRDSQPNPESAFIESVTAPSLKRNSPKLSKSKDYNQRNECL